jgi:hypothetical protein
MSRLTALPRFSAGFSTELNRLKGAALGASVVAGENSRRNFSITFATISTAVSTGVPLLNRPKEKSILPRARSFANFIVRKTCDASTGPVWQAEPAEQQR